METIIQQIVGQLVENIISTLEEKGVTNIDQTIACMRKVLDEGTLNLVSAILEEMDEALAKGAKAQRKKDGIRIKERNIARKIETKIGELEYRRTYFRLPEGNYAYLLDHIVGIEAYERISKELIASILQRTSEQSYRGAIESTGQTVSKQTVHNRLIAMESVAAEVRRVEKTPEELHLFADEDHCHLNPKGEAIVPLVTITEGIDTSNPKRHKTINPFHMAGYGISAACFKENVSAVLYARYDISKIRKIYIHSDGGSWIKGLKEVIPGAQFVMDGFHLKKHIKPFLRLPGAQSYAASIYRSFQEDNIQVFTRYIDAIYNKQKNDKDREAVMDFCNYVVNHWESIILRAGNSMCGSCTEPLISHVLSDRLSRDPISWSRDGLSKMTALLVYTKNGETVEAKQIRIREDKTERARFEEDGYAVYSQYAISQAEAVLHEAHTWEMFEKKKSYALNRVDGTFMVLKSLGSMRSITNIA